MGLFKTLTGLVLDEDDPEDGKILGLQRSVAREAGAQGADREGVTRGRPDLEDEYDQGADEDGDQEDGDEDAPDAAAGRGSRGGKGSGLTGALPTPTLKPPRRAKDASGFALGLVLYALAVSYIRYGPAGPKGWMAAKFLNKPIQGDDLEEQNRKDSNNGVDPAPSGRGPNGEVPAEGHMDDNTQIM